MSLLQQFYKIVGWPNEDVKSYPIFPKSFPKSSHNGITVNVSKFFELALKNRPLNLGYEYFARNLYHLRWESMVKIWPELQIHILQICKVL